MQRVAQQFGRLFRWWWAGLAGAVPPWLARLWNGERTLLAITPDGDGYRLAVERGGRLAPIDDGEIIDLQSVAQHARRHPRALPGLRIPAARCLLRYTQMPAAAAAGDLAAIMGLELERTTPFRPQDVYAAHFVEQLAGGQARVAQAIVKRGVLDEHRRKLASAGVEIAFADRWADDAARQALPIDFLASRGPEAPTGRGRTLVRALALAAAVLALVVGYMETTRHQQALAALSEEAAVLRAGAAAARQARAHARSILAAADALEAAKRTRRPVVVLLDEISRLMPDDAWVSELRIDGDIVDMTGYARQATALLPLFEHSALFEDARFSSPVRFDPAQDRERFGLRVRLRRASETAGAMR